MAERQVVVALPTTTIPSYNQNVLGRLSPQCRDLEEFRGIPYGYVTGRWEHSHVRDCLPDDVFDATRNGPKCPQHGTPNSRAFNSYLPFPDDPQDEFRCLNLLILRPSREALLKCHLDPDTARIPVLVYIHGGGFSDGAASDPMTGAEISATLDPSMLLFRALENGTPIIAVAINYRLGIFGFGASSDMITIQGCSANPKGVNFGLRDQKVALAWVKRNIGAFGGDGEHITIMGHSAGGISCHAHVVEAESGTEAPLFAKAVLLSGALGGLNFRSLTKADECWADLCRHWLIDDREPSKRLQALKSIPPKELLDSTAALKWRLTVLVIDELTIRQGDENSDVYVNLGSLKLHDEVKQPDTNLSVLIGATASDFSGFVRIANWDYAKLHAAFTFCYPDPTAAEKILRAYNIQATPEEGYFEGAAQFISDVTTVYPVHRAGDNLKRHRSQLATFRGIDLTKLGIQTYHFEFGIPFIGPNHGVAHHGVDLIYMFDAFHDALIGVDKGLRTGYAEPGEEAPEQIQSLGVNGEQHARSNIELSRDLQHDLIQFMVEDVQALEQGMAADQIRAYGHQRIARTESWSTSQSWISRRERYDLLEKNLECSVTVAKMLVGDVLGQQLL